MRRLVWIDAWKGVLILLVVLGHVVGGGCHLATGVTRELLRVVYFFVYSFHMPAFFFLVGWMWKDRPLGRFIVRRFARLMVPYLIVGVVSILLFSFVGGNRVMVGEFSSDYYKVAVGNNGAAVSNLLSLLQGGGWPNGQGFRYNTVLWFLPCMFMTQLIYGIVRKWGSELHELVLIAGVSFCVTIGLNRIDASCWPWGVHKVPYYLVFVAIGEIVHRLRPTDRVPVACFPWMLSLAGLFFACVWFFFYQGMRTGWLIYLVRVAVPLLGIYLSMVVAQTIKGWAMSLFCAAGTCSMSIMLWHKFFVVGAQIKVPFVSALYRSGAVGAAVATVGVTVGSAVACWLMANGWKYVIGRCNTMVECP